MDDEAAMLARRVAVDASAWLRHPGDPQVYARLVNAIAVWDAYVEPRLAAGDSAGDLEAGLEAELLDELGDSAPPVLLGEAMPDLGAALRAAARREL